MKIAIIIPAYNRARVLPRAIRSVLNQDYADWALYVVNDGSGDETESVFALLLSDFRIRYPNGRVNRGTLHSQCDSQQTATGPPDHDPANANEAQPEGPAFRASTRRYRQLENFSASWFHSVTFWFLVRSSATN